MNTKCRLCDLYGHENPGDATTTRWLTDFGGITEWLGKHEHPLCEECARECDRGMETMKSWTQKHLEAICQGHDWSDHRNRYLSNTVEDTETCQFCGLVRKSYSEENCRDRFFIDGEEVPLKDVEATCQPDTED